MKIQLKNLSIVNFKGVERFDVNFNHITSIFGDNATGKTTVFDAFLWLFFGKNSEDSSQFEIKRLDANNNFIKDIEAEVSATLLINNQEIVAKKVLRQKWVKRRGELETNYAGDENNYYWNDVPMKEGEFKSKIKEIVDETIFKLITNPFYFNSLKWNERRNILVAIAGDLSNDDILKTVVTESNKEQYNTLITALNQGKSLEEYKRELAAKKKKIKDDAESIPSRIDEVNRGLPENLNFEELRRNIAQLNEKAAQVQASLDSDIAQVQAQNKQYTDALNEHNRIASEYQQKTFAIKTELQNIEFEAKQNAKNKIGGAQSEIDSLNRQINDKQLELERYNNALVMLNTELENAEHEKQRLYAKYDEVEAGQLVFDNNDFNCPSCKRELAAENIEQQKTTLTANFNNDKLKQLEEIRVKGGKVNADIDSIKLRIENGKGSIQQLSVEIVGLQSTLDAHKIDASAPQQSIEEIVEGILNADSLYKSKKSELTSISLKIASLKAPEATTISANESLIQQRDSINVEIQEKLKALSIEGQIIQGKLRIKELRDQEATLNQSLADLEGQEYAILQFTKAKVDAIEQKINGKFKHVKFKMFDKQVNGGESETCETLVNTNGAWVPFPSGNRAGQFNAGIDIINTLSKHYDVYAPIFIDNRESVTELIDSESQIVNLIVSEQDKKLRVI